jgi:hypothetical protein
VKLDTSLKSLVCWVGQFVSLEVGQFNSAVYTILNQGWFEFRRQLDYKLAWNVGWLPCYRRTRAAPVHAAAMSRQTTGRRRRNSCASNAVSRKTPMWSARSMF